MKPERARVLTEGFVAGLIGYAVVALFFAVVNLIADRSVFYTAALLGRGLTPDGAGASGGTVEAGPVLAYNGVHLLAFLVVGLAAAWLTHETDRHPEAWYLAFFIGLTALAFAALLLLLAVPAIGILPWWSVVISNALAAAGMGAFLLRRHPGLWRRVQEGGEPI